LDSLSNICKKDYKTIVSTNVVCMSWKSFSFDLKLANNLKGIYTFDAQITSYMYRFFFRFIVTTLTLLTANLLTTAISDFMVSYKSNYKPLSFTLIGMGIIVVIFYPLFMKLEDWVTKISVKAIKSGNSMAGRSLGLFLTFIVGMVILLYFYAKMWYHIDIFRILINGNIKAYF